MSVELVLDVRNLRRSFGKVHAVQDVSFTVRKGQVVGFIGANGAGKTTTLRLLATLDSPDSGSINVLGCEATNFPDKVRARLGWMPDSYGTYDNVTVVEYLDFYARAYGYFGAARTRHIEEIMAFTELTSIQDRLMHTLSKGMGQRLCLGRALINDPDLLLLDEPAAGLDPKARIEFKNLVRILSQQGKTILISSHILSELGEMCDTMLFIDQGRIVHHGSSETLRRGDEAFFRLEIETEGAVDRLLEWAALQPGLKLVESTNHGARFDFAAKEPGDLAQLLRRAINEGIPIYDFHRLERRLEDAFVEVLKKSNGASTSQPPPFRS
ncbi:MAG TPA: ABC transporter ATP-binding protein [Candidatus Methylacidiphilales bacterium]